HVAPPDHHAFPTRRSSDLHLRVPLGAATAGRHPRGRRVHLSALRADPGSAQPPPRLLILPEEDVPHVRDVLVQDAYSAGLGRDQDRKSTRLNSSHVSISYA